MQNVKLGATGLYVSRLCLGTMTFGLQTEEQGARAILDLASERGINFIDTADVYPLGGELPTAGRTEQIVGRWLAGKRERFVLATKCVGKMGALPWNEGSSRKHVIEAVDASLRRLQTDYIDLYQLHWDDPRTPLEETVRALDDVVRAGKVRYLGVSNFLAYRLALALGKQEARQLARFVCIQPRYSLLFREIERELLPLAREEGLGVIPYNPLAGGLLTGKYDHKAPPPAGSRFTLGTAAERYQERYWHQREFETVEALRRTVSEAGLSLTTVAVAWVLENPAITSAILGASRPEQLHDTLAAAELKLAPELKDKLDALTSDYRKGDATR